MRRHYHVIASTDKGIVLSENQDNVFCCGEYKKQTESLSWKWEGICGADDPLIVGVFDGMGGLQNGEQAALLACRAMEVWYGNFCSGNTDSLKSFIDGANRLILEESAKWDIRMGSTCALLEENDGSVRSWNIGDSRSYLFRDGLLRQLSEDHTEANSMRKIMSGIENERHDERHARNVLTQHFGIEESEFLLEPHVSPWIQMQIGDRLLLCSDGLTHMVEDDEIEKIMRTQQTIGNALSELMIQAKRNGGVDNITIVLIECVC